MFYQSDPHREDSQKNTAEVQIVALSEHGRVMLSVMLDLLSSAL
jgi:hypothetical protein